MNGCERKPRQKEKKVRESNRKLAKMYPDKNLKITQKKTSHESKKAWRGVLKVDAWAVTKHKKFYHDLPNHLLSNC